MNVFLYAKGTVLFTRGQNDFQPDLRDASRDLSRLSATSIPLKWGFGRLSNPNEPDAALAKER